MLINAVPISLFALATAWDLRTGRIPHWLSGGALLLGVLYHSQWGVHPGPLHTLGSSLLGALCTGIVPWILWRSSERSDRPRVMGGGDVYLFTALGAFYGAVDGLEVELVAVLLASLWALGQLSWDGALTSTLWNLTRVATSPFLPTKHRVKPNLHSMARIRLAPAVLLSSLYFHRTAIAEWFS